MTTKCIKHPYAGKIVQGTVSSCHNCSCSTINGQTNSKGEWVPFHYICNECRKPTEVIKKDMWVITDKGKYKPL